MLPHEGLELADQLGVAPQRQVGVDARLHAGEAQLLETRDLGLGEGLVEELREGGPAPERQPSPKNVGSFGRPTLGKRATAFLEQQLEEIAVVLARREP